MKLPILNKYRTDFADQGVITPLPTVFVPVNGLLNVLPETPSNQNGWPWNEQTDPSIYTKRANWPKITIVTPSYNQSLFLEQTIRSVLLQNYPNLEYIVIDGGSSDQSLEIIQKYAPWISYFQSKKDNGQSQAINLGFSLGSGSYNAWLNSDDFYLKDVFYKVINLFVKTRASFLYGYGYNVDASSKQKQLVKIMPFLDYFMKIPGLIQPSTFWSAEIHQPLWEELHCSLDFELWLRLVKGNTRRLIRQPLSGAHIHTHAKTYDPRMKEKWHDDHLKIWSEDAHGEVFEWKRIVFLNNIRRKIYKLLGLL